VAPEDESLWQRQLPGGSMRQVMLQSLLIERCKLVVHSAMVNSPAYALVLATPHPSYRHRSMLSRCQSIPSAWSWVATFSHTHRHHKQFTFYNTNMKEFAAYLSQSSDRPVVEQTGLAGSYVFPLSRLQGDQTHPMGSEEAGL